MSDSVGCHFKSEYEIHRSQQGPHADYRCLFIIIPTDAKMSLDFWIEILNQANRSSKSASLRGLSPDSS